MGGIHKDWGANSFRSNEVRFRPLKAPSKTKLPQHLRPGERQPHWTADPAGTQFRAEKAAVHSALTVRCPWERGAKPSES